MQRLATTAAVLVLCAGCATKSTASRTCEPVPAEFSLPGQIVYRDCAVDQKARPQAGAPQVKYTPPRRPMCARAIIDVVVDSTGHPVPETARVVRSTDPHFGLAVLQNLPSERYEPAIKDGRPVAQLIRVERTMSVVLVAVPAGTPPASVRPPRRPKC